MGRVQEDDPEAFGLLYDRFSRRAFRVALTIARDRARAEDVVQEAFLSVWRSRARFQPDRGTLSAWLLSIVRHQALDAAKAQQRHDVRRADVEQIDARRSPVKDLEERAGEREEAGRLRSTLAGLPGPQREVIALAYFGELSAGEIARVLDVPLGTVKGRIRLGLDKLRASPSASELGG